METLPLLQGHMELAKQTGIQTERVRIATELNKIVAAKKSMTEEEIALTKQFMMLLV